MWNYFNKFLPKRRDVGKEVEDEDAASMSPSVSVRVFISYSHNDKVLAGRLKAALDGFGLEVFLAHEDLDPSVEWQDVIMEHLKRADIFLPLITRHFSESDWTDQESGIAHALDKVIVPIAVTSHFPYGFVAKYQAWKLNDPKTPMHCEQLIEAIIKNQPKIVPYLLPVLIKSFASSGNFDNAGLRAKLLLSFSGIKKEQALEIFQAAATNNQIYGSWAAVSSVKELIKRYHKLVPARLIKTVEEKMKKGWAA